MIKKLQRTCDRFLNSENELLLFDCGLKADGTYEGESGTLYRLGGVELEQVVVEHSGDLLGVRSSGGELLIDRSLGG